MAALIAESEGWRAIYLGADIPASEIAAAALQSNSQAVVLGIQYTCNAHVMAEEVLRLREALPDGVPLIVSGVAAIKHKGLMSHPEILVPDELSCFRDTLAAL
jgi:methylmalonyl-CoA mutase cobalamin-binding subunit